MIIFVCIIFVRFKSICKVVDLMRSPPFSLFFGVITTWLICEPADCDRFLEPTWWIGDLVASHFGRLAIYQSATFPRFFPLFPAGQWKWKWKSAPKLTQLFLLLLGNFPLFFGFRFSALLLLFFPCTRRLMTLFCFSFNWSRTFYLLFHSFHSLSFPPPLCFPSLSFRGAIIGSLGIVACLHGFRYPNVIPHVNLARFVQFVQPAGCQSAAPSISPSICQSMQFTDKVIEPFEVEELHDLRSWRWFGGLAHLWL